MPSLGIALRPEGAPARLPAGAGRGAGYRRLPDGCEIFIAGDWASGNPAFAISRGFPSAPFPTPGPGRWFAGMLLSPSPFGIQVSHPTQEPPSSSSRLSRGCDEAPRGALSGLDLPSFVVEPD